MQMATPATSADGVRRLGSMSARALGLAVLAALAVAPAIAAGQTAGDEVTFTRDVAPIFQRACQTCHRPGAIAPMSLITYEDSRPWARSIRDRVVTRRMPPWFIDKTVGVQEFKDDRSLTDAEIATIAAWVDGGARRGNPADMPPPLTLPATLSRWTMEDEMGREPDLVVPIPEPFFMPADSPNWWVEMVTDPGVDEDRWIKAYETKPSVEGYPVVHHAVTYLFHPGEVDESPELLSEYALGKTGDIHPDGTARLFEAGSQLRWSMHYSAHPNGEDAYDRTAIAFWFYPRGYEPEQQVKWRSVAGLHDLDFPPGENNIRHDGYYFLKSNIKLTVYQPHLHNLGKRQCLEAVYQDGRVQPLSCADWDFGWHIAYNYADHAAPLLPKGTMLHVTSWHDNSQANKWASDPRNWVGWGNRSTDDMALAHMNWYELTDEEYAAELDKRLAARTTNNDN